MPNAELLSEELGAAVCGGVPHGAGGPKPAVRINRDHQVEGK